jgi:glycosyltransferase involved in cell wall biosynthesis
MAELKVDPSPTEGNQRRRTVAVIPAYNEERYIGSVVLKTLPLVDTVIVVDDGSTDATAQIAQRAGALVVRHEENRGKGMALNTGFRRAREMAPDALVLLDGDGQHLPEESQSVLAPVLNGDADIVVGSRYLTGNSGVPATRAWGHGIFTRLTNVVTGTRVTDSQCGFRAFSPRALDSITFASEGFTVESEMQFLANQHGLRLVEVPITSDYVEKPKRPLALHGMLVLNGILRLIGQYRPLLFFGVPGLIVLLLGMGWGWWVVEVYRRTQNLAVGYALVSVLLSILGGLSLFTGLMLHSVRGLLIDLLRAPNAASVGSGSDAGSDSAQEER